MKSQPVVTRDSVSSRQSSELPQSLPAQMSKLHRVCGSYRKNRRGASVVEFAIVAPVFFLLVFGMIEYGRMVMVQQVITNAAREGARQAVLDGATHDQVVDLVVDYGQKAGVSIGSSQVTVTPNNPASAAFGEPVEVSVAIPFGQVSWLPSPIYLGGKTLNAKTVMRRESVQ